MIDAQVFINSNELLDYPNKVVGLYDSEWEYTVSKEPKQTKFTATMNIKREDLIDLLHCNDEQLEPWMEKQEVQKSHATKHGRGIKQIKKDRKKKKRK